MVEEKNKIIITSIIIIVSIAILGCLLFIDLPILGTRSLNTIIEQHNLINAEEAKLVAKQNEYGSVNTQLNESEEEFKSEKAKYEAISDETIKIIKDSNTSENYNLEYMWIKLGNYATKNNLTLVMLEPGNTNGIVEKTEENTDTDSNTQKKDESLVDKTEDEKNESIKNDDDDMKLEENQYSGVLQIQVTGSYMDLSDFIFEVENDTELNFKLDNILMEYVSGTTVKTTFDVKNIIVNK